MKRFFNKRATTSVVALSFLILAVSCVNEKYELSEEKKREVAEKLNNQALSAVGYKKVQGTDKTA